MIHPPFLPSTRCIAGYPSNFLTGKCFLETLYGHSIKIPIPCIPHHNEVFLASMKFTNEDIQSLSCYQQGSRM